MTPIDIILDRLIKPKKQGKGHVACCPAHQDKSPSLVITEADDGRVLLHCFAGCAYSDIMAAIGLTPGDGFAESMSPEAKKEYTQASKQKARQMEEFVIAAAVSQEELNDDDVARLRLAKQRIKDLDAPEPEESKPVAPAGYTPFIPLGYNGTAYYYLPVGTEQVSEIRRGSHTSAAEMLSLAPLEWWAFAYPNKTSVDWYAAANHCMRMCEARGIYSSDRERGRGAWYDAGNPVLHLGGRLIVSGITTAISEHKSDFIYTRQPSLEHGADAVPATDKQATEIAEIFNQLNWSKPIHGMLLAGFCALAPICGGLKWRPHIWLTAQRGAGKSWVQDHIIAPVLGPCAMMVQGGTTEAGIRQRLRNDARPIIFDEAESEDHASQRRIQMVIELARQSSSDSSAEIVKGTVSGGGMSFRMRSMFMLGSVNVALSQAADESRFSVLSLDSPSETAAEIDRFQSFAKHVHNTLTESACASVRARVFNLMPVVRVNAKVFSVAVAKLLGSQRIGDQMGTLLAGWYALHKSTEISAPEAELLIRDFDFDDAKESKSVSDEESLISRIMQAQVRFDTNEGQKSRSIGELAAVAHGDDAIGGMYAREANDVLGRYGVTVAGDAMMISNTHSELAKILKDTPWAAGWKRVIGRLAGARPSVEPVYFAKVRSRAQIVPWGSIF